jgi:hypothetical protein
LLGGLGAFAGSVILNKRIAKDPDVHQIASATSQIIIGLAGLSMWVASFFGLGAPVQGIHDWRRLVVWSFWSIALLVFCGYVWLLAWEASAGQMS